MKLARGLCALTLLFLAGCNQADQERAHERAVEAQRKADEGARKLGHEAKEEARKINRKIGDALDGSSSGSNGSTDTSTSEARRKLDHAGQVAREAGDRATRKLDHAAMLAKVKAKLAADVGMATVSSIEVDVDGPVVTLRGTVSSENQKREAERVVAQVDGVTKVANQLTVAP